MSANWVRTALLLNAVLWAARPGWAQHDHSIPSHGSRLRIGAQAIGLFTRMTPATRGRGLSEGYLTQPMIMGHASFLESDLALQVTLDLEGWTLRRGELNPSIWGEGYVDRRHPHTYLHELIGTAGHDFGRLAVSVAAGKGFAPFGTDDPMVRGFVKYPANHHFSQILERLVAIGAVRFGPVAVEGGVFNGDEPLGPRSNGTLDRFGDSWALRATVSPLAGVELQGSRADVESPEIAHGGGLDQRKWNASARFARDLPGSRVYALAEFARTEFMDDGVQKFNFSSYLGETVVQYDGWSGGLRFEVTVRPEEERLLNPFRSVRPPTDFSILGRTRWTTAAVQLARELRHRSGSVAPLVEVARSKAAVVNKPAPYEPTDFYGDDVVWTLSFGVRLTAGTRHDRMGRYGAAVVSGSTHN